MNLAHLHLILNHIPVVGIPLAIVFLIYGMYSKNLSSQRFSLFILIGLTVMMVPVYLTGAPAEKFVEHLPGVAESFIEAHEDAALYSLILSLMTGMLALLGLWFQKNLKRSRQINFCILCCGIFTAASLLYTANLGGKIRHTELRVVISTGGGLKIDVSAEADVRSVRADVTRNELNVRIQEDIS